MDTSVSLADQVESPAVPVLSFTLRYSSLNSFNRLPISSVSAPAVNRQAQFPEVLLGKFMRASVPSPSKSCKGATAVLATDARATRMKSQWIS